MEAYLAERRKKTSRFNKNGIPKDPALARLILLRQTVCENPTRFGRTVQFLKTPYMTRESHHVELARTIAMLPNLKYVDLPKDTFSDPAYAALCLLVQARCPNVRKAIYPSGSMDSFAQLALDNIWPHLEVLELHGLEIDPNTLREYLACLANLRALKVSETDTLSDEVFVFDDRRPPLPTVEELILEDTPSLTAAGIVDYLSFYDTPSFHGIPGKSLKVLTLKDTGVQPWTLQDVLIMAPSLKTLVIQSKVSDQFPTTEPIHPLAHNQLRTLRFEISAQSSARPYTTREYYSYLANSILAGGFPELRRLYVLNEQFPELLQNLPPPMTSFAGGRGRSSANLSAHKPPPALYVSPPDATSSLSSPNRQGFGNISSPTRQKFGNMPSPSPQNFGNMPSPALHRFSNASSASRLSSHSPLAKATGQLPIAHTLEIYTKSEGHAQWKFELIDSFQGVGAKPPPRPSSSYGLAADVAGQGWDRREARRSVMIGSATGGFLAVSGDDTDSEAFTLGPVPVPGSVGSVRPRSSAGDTRRSRPMWK
jgi:hypothetical protein